MSRTYRGRNIDTAAINNANQHVVALGNASMNARGDKVNRRGEILETAEQVARATYDAQISKEDMDLMNASYAKSNPTPTKEPAFVAERFAEKEFDFEAFKAEEVKPVEVKPVDVSVDELIKVKSEEPKPKQTRRKKKTDGDAE